MESLRDILEVVEANKQLYQIAKGRNSIERYISDKYNLEYAIINCNEVPAKEPHKKGAFSSLNLDIADLAGLMLAGDGKRIKERVASAIANGNYHIFVVKGEVPEEYYGFLAVHEYVELVNRGNHGKATEEEFKEVAKKGEEFLKAYSKWYLDYNSELLEVLNPARLEVLRKLLPEITMRMLEEKICL